MNFDMKKNIPFILFTIEQDHQEQHTPTEKAKKKKLFEHFSIEMKWIIFCIGIDIEMDFISAGENISNDF